MEKSRDGERGEKRGREGVIPQRLDLASAVDALYAPWLQQEQALLSNMFGAAGGPSAYSAAAAAAAMGLGNLPPGLPPGYPPVSSSAGLASLAAAQQAQQAQAAALASLNPSAGKGFYTWWNLAGLQQMELLSRLQGGLGGYPGLHPEHLMNLEILQAQHAAAMAAALSASNKSSSSSAASRTSSNGSTSSTGSATLHSKSASRSGGAGGASGSVSGGSGSGSRSGHSHSSSSRDSRGGVRGSELSRSSFGASENNRLSQQRSSSSASSHHRWARNGSDSGISVRSDLGSASGSLSYGIASLMADKMPSHKTSHRSTPSSTSSSEVIRSKELEIIPISSSMAPGGGLSKDPTKGLFHPTERGLHHSSKASAEREALGLGGRGGGGLFSQAEITPKVSLSSLTNGIPGTLPTPPPSVWKEDSANVSIEPCSRGTPPEDAPLNLSLKAGSHKGEKSGTSASSDPEKRHHSKESSSSDLLMNKLKPPLNPFDYSQGLGLGMGLMPHEMAPSLEVLQSLYGHHGEPRDVLASMQEALQRQLLVADSKKRDEKKRRSRNNSSADEGPEKVRHLGRGVSKPKKNTVASLLEHCRAAGIKPQIPLPTPPSAPTPTTSLAPTPITTSPPLSTQSLPPSLIPIFPPPTPSVSISPFPPPPSTPSSSASPPSSLPPLSLPPSLSISSISSPKPPSSPAPPGGSNSLPPSVTVQPYSSSSSSSSGSALRLSSCLLKDPLTGENNKVEITPVSSSGTPLLGGNGLHPQEGGERKRPSSTVASSTTTTTATITATAISNDGRPSSAGSSVSPSLGGVLGKNPLSGLLSFPYELPEMMSDSDSDDSTSISSVDEDSGALPFPSPWLKMDSADRLHSGSPPTKKRKMITDERSLRVPLMYGWRRETTMRGITQSGVRGEVIYFAPCGKAFKQYPDIIRYLERQNIAEVTRDNFSFSSKITVGEYVDANTQQRYSEKEIRDIVREFRVKKGLRVHQQQLAKKQEAGSTAGKLATTAHPPTDNEANLEAEAEAILRRLEAEDRAKKAAKQEALSKIEEQKNLRAWKEQEKLKKQEELRKEKEEQRKAREELNRQRLYEQLKKAQEREQEKQKQKLIKEQLYLEELNKQREMLYTFELERERRRYHGILVRTLEARKRYEEREKRRGVLREEKRVFKERKKEERQAARELTILLKEAKEDMELTDHHQLPDVPQVACMRLPPEAFGNVLMIFEFLHNFGETLGFDMESLPSLQSLQLAFLGDGESEEELLSVLTHLLVCAIEDPGIPNSQRNTTILGQTLNRADITHANISEILRIYLFANATGEVRTIYGLHGTEKERRETPAKGQEWDERMNENEAYKMSLWLQKVPFLALNPTQKTEVVGYVCHELLQNKAVVKQIEDSLDRHNGLKTEKWKLDARIRKLRMSVARRRLYTTALRNVADANREDSNLSTVSSVCSSPWEGEKGVDRKGEDAKAKDVVEEEDDDEHELDDNDNESANESDAPEEAHAAPDEDEDKNLNMDEANKTLEQLQKQMDQVRQELFETSQQVRGYNAGQDRYQRTLWVLPHAGGPFMEGINTCDYVGRSHFPLDIPTPGPKEGLTLEEAKESLCHHQKHDSPEEGEEKAAVKEELDRKENVKVEQMVEVGLMSPKSEPVKMEVKEERLVNGEPEDHKDLKVKEEREVNHSGVSEGTQQHELGAPKHPLSSNVHLTEGTSSSSKHPTEESECTKGIEPSPTSASSKTSGESPPGQAASKPTDAVLQQPKDPHVCDSVDKDLVATGLGLIPGQYLRPEHVAQCEKLAFSLLPRTPCYPRSLACVPHNSSPLGTPKRGSESPLLHPNSPFVSSNGSTPLSSLTPILQNSLVSNSMSHQELLDKLHQTAEALPIPPEYKTGWWHFNDSNMLQEMTVALNERGARERELKRFLERNINIVKNTLTKVDPDVATFDPLSDDEVIVYDSLGFPARDEAEHWRLDVALKVDLMALEAVYALEEKITNASMQNKNWRLGEVGERSQFEFSPACDPTQDKKNPIHLGRDLLLALEEGIERRYLKPPLGILPAPKSENGVEPKTGLETPKGLGTWREAVFKCETAAQLAMCTYMLETAVAWDKSIMKAYCQFCHSGDFEEKLLLCDGCDRGYHTHCFKPPMDNIPEGDWYCYECVNKFSESSQRHCLVCGGMEGRTLVHCASCPRAYHTTCINPPLTKVPRNKWNCPACSSKSPRGRRGRTKKTPDGGNTPTSVTPSKTPAAAEPTTPTLNQNSGPPPSTNCTSPPKSLVMDPGDTPGEIPLAQNPPAAPPPPPALSPPPPNNVIVVSPSSIPCSFTAVSSPTPVITTTTNTTPNGTTLPSTTPLTAPMTVPSPANHAPKKERGIKKKDLRELMVCKVIQKEMMAHEDAWPFLLPVNTRQFPTYKKIIKKPIDLSTINKRLEDTFYKSKEDYSDDLHLMFNNCETFNEDDSPVGKAGHSLRSFFEAKWNENFLPT